MATTRPAAAAPEAGPPPLPATGLKTSAPGLKLAVRGLQHTFRPSDPPVVAIDRLDLPAQRIVAFTGPSGSGKTTLAYLLTGIEAARTGSIRWGEQELVGTSEGFRDAWRRRHVGFVFQEFQLVPGLSIEANVLIASWFDRVRVPRALDARASELLDSFAVPRTGRRVTDLSRGEQQRVAVARALLHQPPLLVADEPTASLDAKNGAQVIDLLCTNARAMGATLLAVTHDPALIEAAEEVHHLAHGRLEQHR